MTKVQTIAAQLGACAADDVENLIDRDSALDALVKISGKAAIARLALLQLQSGSNDMTLPAFRGLIAILDEIGDDAWNVGRIQFAHEWEKRYGAD